MKELEPQSVWHYFSELCKIPRPSGHLDEIRDYVAGVGRDAGCAVEIDAAGNVLIRKPATSGCEDAPVTALEAHMDMVPQADADTVHDFLKDPILIRREGDNVMATGTTLGADNGIGMASMLAVLSDGSLRHGPVECLFTVDEETGMTGANRLQTGWLRSRYLINTDTETEGTVMTGCAGAVDMEAFFKYKMDNNVPDGDVAIRLSLSGLQGGHSGMDIHLGRANACKLMFRFLKHAVVNFEARLASVYAGGLRNAIPREATAVITVPAELVDDMFDEVAYYNELFRYEWRNIDSGIVFRAEVAELPKALLPEAIQDDLINSIEACHDGVFRRSPEVPAVVETSSNLALVEAAEGAAHVVCLIRSMDEEMKRALASQLQSTFLLGGARVEFGAAYSGWELPAASPLLALARNVYRETFGTEVKIEKVHCGLECGIIAAQYPQLDIISLGPTICHPHSPQEYVSVTSVARYWRYLTSLLSALSTVADR